MMKENLKVRPVFIYFALIAVILGIIGIIIIEENLSGRAITEKKSNIESGEIYTKEEIAGHNLKQDCWTYVNGKVYDITLLLQIYPYDLSQECGKELKPGYFSDEEMSILDEYKIGKLK